jgi:predicted acetyltransferase
MTFLDDARAAIAPARLVRGTPEWGPVMLNLAGWAFGGRAETLDGIPPAWGVDLTRAFGVEVDVPETVAPEADLGGGDDGGLGGVPASSAKAKIAAACSAWGFHVPVPGGRVRTGGLTWVGVRPEYRRRGFLRAMIAAHFADCAARGEPLSLLYASQMPLYPHFGYGRASMLVSLRIPAGAALRPIPGTEAVTLRMEIATFAEHDALAQRVRAEAGTSRRAAPGWTDLVTEGQRGRRFINRPNELLEWESLRIAIAERDGQPTGFAIFRRDGKWDGELPAGTVEVKEFVALDAPSARVLWGALADMELNQTLRVDTIGFDDWPFSLMTDWRAAKPVAGDGLYARLVDVPAALEARRYATDVDLVLEVDDPLLTANAGRWRLRGGRGHAQVSAAGEARADIVGDVQAFSAAYLGGTGLAVFEDAGLISENTPGALEVLDAALHSYRAPGTATGF